MARIPRKNALKAAYDWFERKLKVCCTWSFL